MKELPKKLIFLDIDGVLNSEERHPVIEGLWSIDPVSLEHLHKVIDETDCYFVLSSTWRKTDDYRGRLLKHGCSKKVVERIIDRTTWDYARFQLRGQEILEWLERKRFVGPYIILDDDGDMDPLMHKWFKIHSRYGITENDAKHIIRILNEE